MLIRRPAQGGGPPASAPRLGELLVADGVIGGRDLREALRLQRHAGGLLGTNLLERGSVSEPQLLGALGKHLRSSTISGVRLRRIPREVIQKIPADIARRYRVVPFQILGTSLRVAAIDPSKAMLVENAIRSRSSLRVRAYVALECRIEEALKKYYGHAAQPRIEALTRRLQRQPATTAPWSWPRERAPELPQPTDALHVEEELLRDPPPQKPSSWEDRIIISTQASDEALTEVHMDSGGVEAEAPKFNSGAYVVEPAKEQTQEKKRPAPRTIPPLSSVEPEERLREAGLLLKRPLTKNQIAQVVLEFCEPYLERRVLFLQRRDRVVGWKATGEQIDQHALQLFWVRSDTPSVFYPLTRGAEFWMGPMPPFDTNRPFEALLGGETPRECAVVPIELRRRAVAYIYGDNRQNAIGQVPLKQLRRLAAKAGLAFELCILRSKMDSA